MNFRCCAATFALLVMLAPLASCSAPGLTADAPTGAPESTADPAFAPLDSGREKLLGLDIGHGFSLVSAGPTVHWTLKDKTCVLLQISAAANDLNPPSGARTIREGGIEYKSQDGALPNKTETYTLYWTRHGYHFALEGFSDLSGKGDLAVISPATAELVSQDCDSDIAGQACDERSWEIVFKNNRGTFVRFTLDALLPDNIVYLGASDRVTHEDGIEYKYHPGVPFYYVWFTDKGFCILSTGYEGNLPSVFDGEDLSFVSLDLVKRITELMGAKYLPLPDSTN